MGQASRPFLGSWALAPQNCCSVSGVSSTWNWAQRRKKSTLIFAHRTLRFQKIYLVQFSFAFFSCPPKKLYKQKSVCCITINIWTRFIDLSSSCHHSFWIMLRYFLQHKFKSNFCLRFPTTKGTSILNNHGLEQLEIVALPSASWLKIKKVLPCLSRVQKNGIASMFRSTFSKEIITFGLQN